MQTLGRRLGARVIRTCAHASPCLRYTRARAECQISYVYEFREIPTRNRCRRLCRQISPGLFIIIIICYPLLFLFHDAAAVDPRCNIHSRARNRRCPPPRKVFVQLARRRRRRMWDFLRKKTTPPNTERQNT